MLVVAGFLLTGPGPATSVVDRAPQLSAFAAAVAVLVPAFGALVRGVV